MSSQAQTDDLDRVTPALLRGADEVCPRRLALEHGSVRKPSRLGDGPFEVANRLTQDAIAWHKAGDPTTPGFPEPLDLEVEQQAVYRAASGAYARMFGAATVEVHDLGWSSDFPELGVRMYSSVGIAVVDEHGSHELRVLRIGARGLLDSVDLRCLLLRTHEWAHESLRVVAADLLEYNSIEYDIDVVARIDEAREWLAERVAAIRARADKKRAHAGADCRACAFIPGCPPITKSL